MVADNLKESVIAAEVEHQLGKNLVYGQLGVTNRNYEGEVQYKKSVTIVGVGGVTIFDVPDNADMPDPQNVSDASTEMQINNRKGFNFKVQRVDQAQTVINMQDQYNQESAQGMADAVDQIIAGLHVDASSKNLVGSNTTPKVPNVTQGDASNIYNLLEDCGTALSDSRVPTANRWMIVPPWIAAMIRKDLKLTQGAAPQMSQEAMMNGQVAKIANFAILESPNVPNTNGTKYKMLFGTSRAITFANQVQEVRILQMEKQFAKKVDGFNVFGCKVVRPDCLGVLTASKS